MVVAVTGPEGAFKPFAQVAESGARVIATARNLEKAPGLQALAQAHARERLQVVALDVTDAASLKVCDSAYIRRTLQCGDPRAQIR